MGLFSPKYPTGAEPPRRESRADRRHRESREQLDAAMAESWKAAEQASEERSAAFWADYEQQNGPGSLDRT
jgi:hypothetical protein